MTNLEVGHQGHQVQGDVRGLIQCRHTRLEHSPENGLFNMLIF